jgi:RNA polymerase subunit RPABC4/transcription elongation factor Spt4
MKQLDSSLIAPDAIHDFHHCVVKVPCEHCGSLFAPDDDEELCPVCAHASIERTVDEIINTAASLAITDGYDYAWKYGYLSSMVASMAAQIPDCLDYLAERKISA